MTYECFVAVEVLTACGLNYVSMLQEQQRLVRINAQYQVTEAGEASVLEEWLPKAARKLQLLNSKRYSHLHGWKSLVQLARRILNGYFGYKCIAPERQGGGVNRTKFRLAYGLVPGWCLASRTELGNDVRYELDVENLEGDWERVRAQEAIN